MIEGSASCLLNIPYGVIVLPTDIEAYLEAHPNPDMAFSLGLHPWNVDEAWEDRVEVVRKEATLNRVWAIGECGLDKLRGASFDLQLKAFHAQIAIAEELRKPMVIHCVKAFSELMAIRKDIDTQNKLRNRLTMPWVVHGFRGKPDLAKQIMARGLLLSFGHLYNAETLRQVFTSCRPFFLETDDCRLPIFQIYEQVGRHLGVDVAHLDALCDPRHTVFADFLRC